MESVNMASLDELFKLLNENKPITTDLIKTSTAEYLNAKKALQIKQEANRKSPAPTENAEVYKCPRCKKDIPFPHQPTITNDPEKEEMARELDARTLECQQMEQHIIQMEQHITQLRQVKNHKTPTPPPPPQVIDPGDPNRAQQIGERYESLYGNEWTDAFKFLDNTKNLREDKVLDTLLRILRAAYTFCDDIARAQMVNIEGEIYCPLSTWTEDARIDFIGRKASLPVQSAKLAQTYRKSTSIECIPAIQKAFVAQILPEFMDPTLYNNRQVMTYVKRCVELTWYMVIQETSMVLVSKVNRKSPFDTNLFRFYSTSGDKYDFVVWPALLMYSEGPIIIKGLAHAWDPNRSIPNVRESPMETSRVPPRGKEDMGDPDVNINQGVAGGTPWGSNYFTNTPSVDLPPLPLEHVSPTRVSPARIQQETERQLTATWKDKKKPNAKN